jgi:Ni/Co efflux regulator RcnB
VLTHRRLLDDVLPMSPDDDERVIIMKKFLLGLVATAAVAAPITLAAAPAEAATDFANCDAMHRVFKYGVAKSKAAANRTYRNGHYRPAVRPLVYKVNNESDADNDRTACEVTR